MSRPKRPTFIQCACGSWFKQHGTKARCTPCSSEHALRQKRTSQDAKRKADRAAAREGARP